MTQRIIDVQEGDPAWVAKFESDIRNLCGLVEEAFETNKLILLSPVFRELIRDRARQLESKLNIVRNRLCVDNIGDPLGSNRKDG